MITSTQAQAIQPMISLGAPASTAASRTTFAAAIVGPVVMSIYWERATGMAATITVIFAIVGNLVISSLAARDVITVPEYMQVGGISLLVSILLFYGISLVTSNRHPDATLGFLYGGPGARADSLLTGTAAGTSHAAGTAAGAAPPAASPSPSPASAERPDHV